MTGTVRRSAGTFPVGCIAGCALAALACSDLPADGVLIETDQIINGTSVATDNIGTPVVDSAEICSGTMIRKDWLLTAKHCLTWQGGRLADASEVRASIKDGEDQLGARIVRHLDLDVALVSMTAPLTGTSGQTFANPLYVGSDASLVSQPVEIQGWGFGQITSCSDGGATATGDVTGLKSMTAPINQMSSATKYRMVPAFPGGQIAFIRDSGSTPFTTVNNFRRPTGVTVDVRCHADPLQVYEAFFVRSDAFRGWLQGVVGTGITGGPISGFERPDKASVIVYTNGTPLHVKMLAKGSPGAPDWTLTDLGGTPRSGSDVPSYVRADGTAAVLYVNTSNHIIEVRPGFNGSWVSTDITADGIGSNVAAGGHIAAYVRSDNVTSVVYASSDGNIRELKRAPGAAHWVSNLLTAPGSPSGGNPVGYVRGDATNAVVYVDQVGHIQQLTLANGWSRSDLTDVTGAPAVAPGAVPHVYSRSDGYSIVLYRDVNQDIWELAMTAGGSWSAADLTSMFACRKAASDPYGYVRSDGLNAVVFKGTDSHPWELFLGGTWFCNDLQGTAPEVGAVGPYPFVGSDLRSHVVYRSGDGHIRDLRFDGDWIHTDPTQIAGGQ